MTLDIFPRHFGISPSAHPYAAPLSSSASSSTSSVFSDAASQASSTSSTSCPSTWESDEWSSSTGHVASAVTIDPVRLAAFQPVSRSGTFPQYQSSACRETVQERLPSLRAELMAPVEQRQHPRRSSTAINQRAPPQLVRQSERKVNFVDCLVGQYTHNLRILPPLTYPRRFCYANGRGHLATR